MAFKWISASSRFRNSSGYVFQDLFAHFHDFWCQIGVVILVTLKQEVERKSEWFCGVKFFRSNFKVELENGVWPTIRFLASGFLFTCGNFTLTFTVFSIFWIGLFFLNGFPSPFMVHYRPSFCLLQFSITLWWFFCSHAAFWHWFLVFLIWFFEIIFPIQSLSVLFS